MGNEVILNKDKFKDSNGTEYELRELENYDFSNDWEWEREEYYKITDIYEKTFFDVATYLLSDLRADLIKREKKHADLIKREKEHADLIEISKKYVDLIEIGKEYAEDCQRLLHKEESPKKQKLLKTIDPDSDSSLLQEIYKKLWNDKYLKECKDSEKIKGETMNSIWTTLNKVYEFIEQSKKSDQREWRKKLKQNVSKKYLLCRYAESRLNGEFVSDLDKIQGLRTFLESAHRLGNFIPVPKGCNGPRGSGILKDYWDLTLKVIYDYYAHKEEYKTDPEYHGNICKIVGAENVDKYKAWLDSFENWDNFVRKNYMRAFVDEGKDGEGYGEPRELWEGHFENFFSLKRSALPENTKQAEQFFKNASSYIRKRTNDMIAELEKIVNEEAS